MRSREPYHCWGNRCQGVIVVARLRKLSGSRQSTTDCRLTHTSTDCGRVVAYPSASTLTTLLFGCYSTSNCRLGGDCPRTVKPVTQRTGLRRDNDPHKAGRVFM